MRVALLSDIHGNSIALDAVLADASSSGVDRYWILGDIVALGHDPVGVLQRLSMLPNSLFIRGNTDRYVVTGDRPPPHAEDIGTNHELLQIFSEIAGSFAWTQGAITVTGWFDWLSQLPLELHSILPDGTKFLGVHAAPGNDDGVGIHPGLSDAAMRKLLTGCVANLICVGHTHQPVDRKIDDWHIINLGSISNPRTPDLRASYVILDATPKGYAIEHRRVEYDRDQVIALLQNMHHPGEKFIIRHMRGLIK